MEWKIRKYTSKMELLECKNLTGWPPQNWSLCPGLLKHFSRLFQRPRFESVIKKNSTKLCVKKKKKKFIFIACKKIFIYQGDDKNIWIWTYLSVHEGPLWWDVKGKTFEIWSSRLPEIHLRQFNPNCTGLFLSFRAPGRGTLCPPS